MPHTKTKTVYFFEELNDKAKEKARDWFRQGAFDHDWWNATYEDFDTIAAMLGVELDRKDVPLMSGKTRQDPCIWFSGFSSQGDGACFEGRYSYAKGAAKKIRAYAPQDSELHRIADELQEIQRKHGYRLEARVKHSGHYYHKYCTQIDVTNARTGDSVDSAVHDATATWLRDLMQWLYRSLETEFDYQNADEQIDDSIIANEYEFTESGRRAC